MSPTRGVRVVGDTPRRARNHGRLDGQHNHCRAGVEWCEGLQASAHCYSLGSGECDHRNRQLTPVPPQARAPADRVLLLDDWIDTVGVLIDCRVASGGWVAAIVDGLVNWAGPLGSRVLLSGGAFLTFGIW